VTDPSPLLDRAGIEDAFRRLGERLARHGVVADLHVFGQAAMALAYGAHTGRKTGQCGKSRAGSGRADTAESRAGRAVIAPMPGGIASLGLELRFLVRRPILLPRPI
jgi:hypothetical protein